MAVLFWIAVPILIVGGEKCQVFLCCRIFASGGNINRFVAVYMFRQIVKRAGQLHDSFPFRNVAHALGLLRVEFIRGIDKALSACDVRVHSPFGRRSSLCISASKVPISGGQKKCGRETPLPILPSRELAITGHR